jgi:hypothetical protein
VERTGLSDLLEWFDMLGAYADEPKRRAELAAVFQCLSTKRRQSDWKEVLGKWKTYDIHKRRVVFMNDISDDDDCAFVNGKWVVWSDKK